MKNFAKSVALMLALVIAFGAMPLAAFAEENAVAPTAICTHTYLLSYTYTYENCGSNHIVHQTEVYRCSNCSSSYIGDTYSFYANHSYADTPIGVDEVTGATIYVKKCACGAYK